MDWKIIGHQWAVNLLQGHIEHDTVRHAYLITGPKAIGRRTLALRFTQALNCPNTGQTGSPCFSCHTCQRIMEMAHPDLFPITSGEDSLEIKVDQIREVIHSLSLSAYEAPYRVALLLNFEEANEAASNALLKTLEEPPQGVVIIITAESADSLLETIVSRCEEIRLRPIPIDVIQNGLQKQYQLSPTRAELLAHVSGGRPGYALQLQKNPALEERRQRWLDDHLQLLQANRVERFAYAKKIKEDPQSLQELLKVWISLWRDIMLLTSNSSSPIHNLDKKQAIENIADRVAPDQARKTIGSMERALTLIENYANTQLTAEIVMLDLPKIPHLEG